MILGVSIWEGSGHSMASLLLDGEREDDDHGVPSSLLQKLKIPDSSNQQQDGSGEPATKTVAPQPGFCMKTKTDRGDKVFINICWSDQVPSPRDVTDQELLKILDSEDPTQYRIPLSLGSLHTALDNAGKECSVYDVIVSSQFYETVQKRPMMKEFLTTVVLEGLEEKYSMWLCRECRVLKHRRFMGQVPEQQRVRQKPKPFIIEVDSDKQQNVRKLVEEVDNDSNAPEPEYTILREPVEGELPQFLVMEVQLPAVRSGQQLSLEMGEDRLLLIAHPLLYHLAIDLPFMINDEDTGAQFNNDTKILTITLPVTGVAITYHLTPPTNASANQIALPTS